MLTYATAWASREGIMLSEESRNRRKYCMITLNVNLYWKKPQIYKDREQWLEKMDDWQEEVGRCRSEDKHGKS